MKLKTKTILQLCAGLNGLSLRPRVTESEGEAVAQAYEPYSFPAQTKVNIIRNLQILRPLQEVFQEAQQAAIKETGGTIAAIKADRVLGAKFADRIQELQNAEIDVRGLLFINWTDLDMAKVPSDVIVSLGFLVKGIPKQNDEDLIPEA